MMPLSPEDRRFVKVVYRLKIYVVILAIAVLIYLLFVPSDDIQMVTSVVGVALCGVFWLTQRLLTLITVLDFELTRVSDTLRRCLPDKRREGL
jgi:hypothetical protein